MTSQKIQVIALKTRIIQVPSRGSVLQIQFALLSVLGNDMWESKMAILLSRTHNFKKKLTILLRDVKEDLMK